MIAKKQKKVDFMLEQMKNEEIARKLEDEAYAKLEMEKDIEQKVTAKI